MRRQIGLLSMAALASLASLAACKRGEPVPPSGVVGQDPAAARATAAAADSAVASGAPIVIYTTKHAVDLTLAHDTVSMGLSDSVLAKARTDMDRDTDEDTSELAQRIGGMIKRGVASALKTRVTYPISDIESARYEDGAIRFAYRNKHRFSFENVHTDNNRDVLSAFAPADAQRFVAAVNAAIRAQGK
jgi:predicted small lipoprotein YifL